MADTYIKFKDLQVHDDRFAMAREFAANRTLAFAGIHDLDVESAIFSDFASGTIADNGMGDETGTWDRYPPQRLRGVGDGAASTWYKILHDTSLELGWVAQFDKFNNRGAFIFCSDTAYNGYLIFWDGAHVSLNDMTFGVVSLISQIGYTETGNATITVSVRPVSYTDVDEVDDLVISFWYDGHLVLTHVLAYDDTKGDRIGLAVYESDSCTFDNLWVPQLHQLVEWTSVDPGELAGSGFSRVVRESTIRFRSRYDGSVKIWKPGVESSDWVVPSGRYRDIVTRRNAYAPNHFRLVGAKHETDSFRAGNQGHIFDIGQDPNALSEETVYNLSVRKHKDIEELADIATITGPPNPVIEPEDILTLNGTERRVESIVWSITWQGSRDQGAPVLNSSVILREKL